MALTQALAEQLTKITANTAETAEDEKMLIKRCQDGQTAAYEKLYAMHVGKIYALCLRLCKDPGLAEDMTQEAFIKGWQKITQFRGDSAFSTWLYRLSSNLVIDHLRQRKNWQLLSENEAELNESAELSNITKDNHSEHSHDLEAVLACLPEQARAIIILYEIVGYQHNEIAAITGLAIGTCKSHLHRARKLLQEQFT